MILFPPPNVRHWVEDNLRRLDDLVGRLERRAWALQGRRRSIDPRNLPFILAGVDDRCTGNVSVTVLDDATSAPISGASVAFYGPEGPAGAGVTGAGGVSNVFGLKPAGSWRAVATYGGYYVTTGGFDLACDATATATIRLKSTGPVSYACDGCGSGIPDTMPFSDSVYGSATMRRSATTDGVPFWWARKTTPAIEAVTQAAVLDDTPCPFRTAAPAYLLYVYYCKNGVSQLMVTGSWVADAFGPRATSSSCITPNYARYWAMSGFNSPGDSTPPADVAPGLSSAGLAGSPVGSGTICTQAAWTAAFDASRPGLTPLGAMYPGAAGVTWTIG